MLKAALDVYYRNGSAKAICVLFNHWADEESCGVYTKEIARVQPYEPGQFYKRELPCLLEVLKAVDLELVDVLIVDGYVYLDEDKTYGLGGHLYEAMNRAIPVVGIAKTKFYSSSKHVVEVKRGNSRNPLFITAIGMEVEKAAQCIKSMAGEYRIPMLLKQLDQLTRQKEE